MNNKKEGEYYSQMVRRYKNEYGGKRQLRARLSLISRNLVKEPVTLRYRHKGLRHYIKSQLHRDPTNGDIYIFLSKECNRIRLYYYHHQGEILSEKILNASHFVEPVFDEKKRVYHISWERIVRMSPNRPLMFRRKNSRKSWP